VLDAKAGARVEIARKLKAFVIHRHTDRAAHREVLAEDAARLRRFRKAFEEHRLQLFADQFTVQVLDDQFFSCMCHIRCH